jgi:hypothetical protein
MLKLWGFSHTIFVNQAGDGSLRCWACAGHSLAQLDQSCQCQGYVARQSLPSEVQKNAGSASIVLRERLRRKCT